jgi:protein-tyrosine phosphatase
MSGFVDIHSHIVWGVDDGAQDLGMTLEMLRIAAQSGTTDIVATPHSDLRFSFDPDIISSRIREILASPGEKPRIHTGCDFHLHVENVADCLAHPTKYTINHLRYLMVEFSDLSIPRTIGQVLERMMGVGITPIITHPERNGLLMADWERLTEWIHAGCLLQVTAQSFLGRFGKLARNAAFELMSRRMVHFVASDAHDPVKRSPDLTAPYKFVTKRYGLDVADRMFVSNPSATLTGAPIEIEVPRAVKKLRKWFFF